MGKIKLLKLLKNNKEELPQLQCGFTAYTNDDLPQVKKLLKQITTKDDLIRRKGIVDFDQIPKVNDKRACYITKNRGRKNKENAHFRFKSLQNPVRIVEILKGYLCNTEEKSHEN
jgi:hypothetical protein